MYLLISCVLVESGVEVAHVLRLHTQQENAFDQDAVQGPDSFVVLLLRVHIYAVLVVVDPVEHEQHQHTHQQLARNDGQAVHTSPRPHWHVGRQVVHVAREQPAGRYARQHRRRHKLQPDIKLRLQVLQTNTRLTMTQRIDLQDAYVSRGEMWGDNAQEKVGQAGRQHYEAGDCAGDSYTR